MPGPVAQTAEMRARMGTNIYVFPNPATREALAEFQKQPPSHDDPTGERVMFNNLPAAAQHHQHLHRRRRPGGRPSTTTATTTAAASPGISCHATGRKWSAGSTCTSWSRTTAGSRISRGTSWSFVDRSIHDSVISPSMLATVTASPTGSSRLHLGVSPFQGQCSVMPFAHSRPGRSLALGLLFVLVVLWTGCRPLRTR